MTEATVQFNSPPVAELALSVQFAPLTKLRLGHFGLLWQRFRDDFPRTEEHPPLPRLHIEDEPKFFVHVGTAVDLPRVWFLKPDGSELIQVQSTRFARNWRRYENEEAA